jgi:DNA-binding LacI/PurR family transcriptional regulator
MRRAPGGLTVPDDVTVVGFDDDPLAAGGRPPLTTARQDLAAKGRAAADALFAAMEAMILLVAPGAALAEASLHR